MNPFLDQTTKPLKRTPLRRKLGRYYYQFKRKLKWTFESKPFSKRLGGTYFNHSIISHKSILLRPLRDVDMQLQHNKTINLRLAVKKLDGLVIQPGEVFSFWYLVGNPTEKKGYLTGLVLNQGKIDKGIGGGLCQLGNLLCWMALHSPLKIKERYRHGYDVFPDVNRKIPFGSGATLSYNYIDFQLENTTSHSFQLKLHLSDSHLNGEILCEKSLDVSYEVFETNHRIVHQSWGGYTRHNQIKRKVIHKGDTTEELVFENHAIMMYNPLLEA